MLHQKNIQARTKAKNKKIKNQSQSERLWSFEWPEILFDNGEFRFQKTNYDEIKQFVARYSNELFKPHERETHFLFSQHDSAKEKYYSQEADLFAFINKETSSMVGFFVSNPLDWQSYYFRYINIHPNYRKHGLCVKACKILIQHLTHGFNNLPVKKIELDVSLSNTYQNQRLSKLGFNVTGTSLSEVWGATNKMTYFISENHRKIFIESFCLGQRSQLDH